MVSEVRGGNRPVWLNPQFGLLKRWSLFSDDLKQKGENRLHLAPRKSGGEMKQRTGLRERPWKEAVAEESCGWSDLED